MNAVIYCRVSSKDQVEGTSLESQEQACRTYARQHNLNVLRVFVEEGESAKFANRTQLLELLNYCKVKRHEVDTLLVWKVDRFARNVEDHFSIKAVLRKHGVSVVSVTEPIQADPTGKLMETVLAGFAQFDNDVKAQRTVEGLKQRVREGIWPWKPPLGYVAPKIGKKTEPDRPDPSRFELLQKAWHLYATGAYSKAAVVRFLQGWGVCGYRGEPIAAQLIDNMFANPFYAGLMRDPWTGTTRPGRHMPMISPAVFAKVQELITHQKNSQSHCRLHDAFPLRGLVRCPSCNGFMTASFSRGRRKRYGYYHCNRSGCRRKSFPVARVHAEFYGWLAERTVQAHLTTAIVERLMENGSDQSTNSEASLIRRKDERLTLERQLQELIEMRTSKLIADDEFIAQRGKLRKRLLHVKTNEESSATIPPLSKEEAREVVGALSDLRGLWDGLPIESQQAFRQIVFPGGYAYQRSRTAEEGLVFKVFGGLRAPQSHVVPNIKPSWNTIIVEIRRLLAIVRPALNNKKEAA